MLSEEKQIILRVVERFVRTGSIVDEQVKVTCLPENKTSTVEYSGSDSRSIMLDKYKVDGRTIWAGYSVRTGMVFLSAGQG
jgi:hypothetical protein